VRKSSREEGESKTACTDLSAKEKLEILKDIHVSPIGRHAGIMRIQEIEAVHTLVGFEKCHGKLHYKM
jgi:hypothetical protein